MKVLFLSLMPISDLSQRNIYTDLLRQFVARGHFVRIVSPTAEQETADLPRDGYAILRVKTPQIAGVGFSRHAVDQSDVPEQFIIFIHFSDSTPCRGR